jgi:hypothetical protein
MAEGDERLANVVTGTIVVRDMGEQEWLVTWVPTDTAEQPASSLSSSRGEVPRVKSIEEVIAWAKRQAWALSKQD